MGVLQVMNRFVNSEMTTPFSDHARDHGRSFMGGKPDDLSIACIVVE